MQKTQTVRYGVSTLSDYDIFLFKQGTHYTLYEKIGAQRHTAEDGTEGIAFSVWAPNARTVINFNANQDISNGLKVLKLTRNDKKTNIKGSCEKTYKRKKQSACVNAKC